MLLAVRKPRAHKARDPQVEAIAQRMRGIRLARGLTQQEVADGVGVTLRAYQHYEAGRRQPKIADAPSIADALGVRPCQLFSSEEPQGASVNEAQSSPEAQVLRDLAQEWGDLPEPEREFITGLVELRRRYRERVEGG